MRHRARNRAFIGAQFIAILLLQSYFLLPLYRQAFVPQGFAVKCLHDHQLCGCAPSRIAEKSCCCFRDTPSCCKPDNHNDDEHSQSAQTRERAPHSLINAPCGGYSGFSLLSPDNLTFLHADNLATSISFERETHPRPRDLSCISQAPEPPDPPPRLVTTT